MTWQQLPVELLWKDIVVALVEDPFLNDGIWYARDRLLVAPEKGAAERELYEYVKFCEDWNERTRDAPGTPPDPREFRRYDRLLSPELWAVRTQDGTRMPISEPPVFFAGAEVTWRP